MSIFLLAGACDATIPDSQALDLIDLGCAAGATAGADVGASEGTTCDCDVQRHYQEVFYNPGTLVDGIDEVCAKNETVGCAYYVGYTYYGSCWAEAYIRACSEVAVQQGCGETCDPEET